jgi:pimeloyl-ACP methyl ester carboxylesterase
LTAGGAEAMGTAGAGDPILLLHGQPGSARDWDGVVERVGSRATVLAIDRPGWDRRTRAAGLDGNADAGDDRHGNP